LVSTAVAVEVQVALSLGNLACPVASFSYLQTAAEVAAYIEVSGRTTTATCGVASRVASAVTSVCSTAEVTDTSVVGTRTQSCVETDVGIRVV
jgi:hypothetical protein